VQHTTTNITIDERLLARVQILVEYPFPISVALFDLFVEKVYKCNGVPEIIVPDKLATAFLRENCYVRLLGEEVPPRRFVDLITPYESFIYAHQGRDFVLISLCQLVAACAERISGTEKLCRFLRSCLANPYYLTYMWQMAVQN
jgi:hypothetical protein